MGACLPLPEGGPEETSQVPTLASGGSPILNVFVYLLFKRDAEPPAPPQALDSLLGDPPLLRAAPGGNPFWDKRTSRLLPGVWSGIGLVSWARVPQKVGPPLLAGKGWGSRHSRPKEGSSSGVLE